MNTFHFCTAPVEFTIESTCATPEDALREALKHHTDEEILLLDYLREDLQEQISLKSIECMFFDQDAEPCPD
jgi:hypothetical protein